MHREARGARDPRAPRALLATGLVVAVGGLAMLVASALGWGTESEEGAPPTSVARRARVAILVVGPSGTGERPEGGALVRLVARDASDDDCERPLSGIVRTDAAGLASLEVPDPVPAGASLEVARADADGLRHGMWPWEGAGATGAGPRRVRLPAGGTLRIVLSGLPMERRPAALFVHVLAPPPDCHSIFDRDLPLPASEGGLVSESRVPRAFSAPVREDGVATMLRVPGDHAVTVEVPDAPAGWLVASASYDGPSHEGRDGEVLRVPDGRTCTYVLAWRRRPTAHVLVRHASGAPVVGASVAVGLSGPGNGLFPAETTDAAGRVDLVLWTGPRVPSWLPDGLVAAAYAPGLRAKVVEWPFRWGDRADPSETIVLEAAGPETWAFEGALRREDGRPVPDVPLLVECDGAWNGHVLVPPLRATTDAEGRWRAVLRADAGPLFQRGGKVRVTVDVDRLPERPRGPRAPKVAKEDRIEDGVLDPAVFAVPAEGGVTPADAVLRIAD